MPGVDGIEGDAARASRRRPEARVLMLTMFDLDEYVFGALRAGASGFLLKTAPPAELAAAIRASHGGEHAVRAVGHAAPRRVLRSTATAQSTSVPRAARRADRAASSRCCEAIARGLSNAEIGAELYMGEATVKTHVTRILAKLGLRDRVQAVVLAYECGLARRSGE